MKQITKEALDACLQINRTRKHGIEIRLKKIDKWVIMRVWEKFSHWQGQSYDYLQIWQSETQQAVWHDGYVSDIKYGEPTTFDSYEDAESVCTMIADRWKQAKHIPVPIISEKVVIDRKKILGSFEPECVWGEYKYPLI